MLECRKLSTRIAMGFSLPLIVTIAIGLWVSYFCTQVKEKAALAKDESLVFAETAYQMKLDVVQVQQWLSDISATRDLDGLNDGFDKAEASARSFLTGLEKFREMYRKENDGDGLGKLDVLGKTFQEYHKAGVVMAKAYVERGPEEGNQLMSGFDKAAGNLDEIIQPFLSQQTGELHETMEQTVALARRIQLTLFGAGLLIILSTVFIGWMISRSLSKVLVPITEGLQAGAAQTAAASSQLSSGSQELAEGASEQAAAIEETSSALEEISSMVRQNAENSTHANSSMRAMSEAFEEARSSMNELGSSMTEIAQASEATQKIIKTIDEIAFQTNLLALNAAVEAARAGEAGAGFAVVADEVRNLAMRAADAARNTADLIEETVRKVNRGAEMAGRAGGAFERVLADAKKAGELVGEINAATQEQAQGIDQVTKAVTEMDKVVQKNAANAEETAAASEELTAQAEQMKSYVHEVVALVNGKSRAGADSYSAMVTGEHRAAGIRSKGQGKHTLAATVRPEQNGNGKGNGRALRPKELVQPEREQFNDF